MNKYKTFEELKEELGDEFEEYMYKSNIELLTKIDKAIEYGKSCINENLDVEKLDEEYKDIFKIAYEIHKYYLEILGDKE